MFKRLMILGTVGIVFVLGANYLLVYALNQQAKRERDRQNPNYWNAYAAIVRFGQHPDSASEQRAKAALDEASQKGLSKTRAKILQNYLEDLERCFQGQRDSCKQATSDMNEAMRVPAERQ
jgi:flagellar biosynthesis chaperone FliJ